MPTDIPHLSLRLAILAASFCLSAFFSGSETALFRFQPDELERMKSGKGPERAIALLRSRPKRLLITVGFGNMVVNVIFFSVSYLLILDLEPKVGPSGALLLAFASLLTIIIGGEVMPKNFAVSFYKPLGRAVALPLLVAQKVLVPIVVPLGKVADAAARLAGGRTAPSVLPEELLMLVDIGEKEGVVDARAAQMIEEVIGLSDIRLNELMVPRVEMVSFDLNGPPERLLALFRETKLSMIPVYDGKVDNMRGLVHIKDVLLKPQQQPLADLVRPIPFLPETATVVEALRESRRQRSKTAFVVDEYGAVVGLVTIEDLLEEIVGDITDEYDPEKGPAVEPLGNGRFRVEGRFSLRAWEEMFGIEVPDMGVDTVGGFVTALLERVPKPGDVARYGDAEFTVEAVEGRRVGTVLVTLPDPGPGRKRVSGNV